MLCMVSSPAVDVKIWSVRGGVGVFTMGCMPRSRGLGPPKGGLWLASGERQVEFVWEMATMSPGAAIWSVNVLDIRVGFNEVGVLDSDPFSPGVAPVK